MAIRDGRSIQNFIPIESGKDARKWHRIHNATFVSIHQNAALNIVVPVGFDVGCKVLGVVRVKSVTKFSALKVGFRAFLNIRGNQVGSQAFLHTPGRVTWYEACVTIQQAQLPCVLWLEL
jgi:hypothetical protein